MNQLIENVVDGTLNQFHANGYSSKSMHSMEQTYHTIIKMHTQMGSDTYDPQVITAFQKDATQRFNSGKMQRIRFMHLLKCIDYLRQYHDEGVLDFTTRNISSGLTPYYEEILQIIKDYPDWSDATKRNVRKFSMPYMKWLASNGTDSFKSVTESEIRSYFIDCANRLSLNSMDTVKREIKKFHWLLYQSGIAASDFSNSFSFVTPTEHAIKRPADLSEVAEVLNSIDRSTPIGKRDYAVILLATITGLRTVDITNLTFDEVDWVNGEIKIIQSKTGNQLALPLTKDIGLAIQDYILNGRPQVNDSHVFLRAKSPFTKSGRSLPYQAYNQYRLNLGLPKQSFHALRRALGTNMVIAGVPVTTVSQVLGHSNIEPTKQYISLDSINLKQCALSFDDYKSNEEVPEDV